MPFWIAIISLIALKKQIEGYKWVTMLIAYCGIMITCTSNPTSEGKYQSNPQELLFGSAVCAVCAIGWSCVALLTKQIKELDSMLICFHYGWMATIFSLPPLLYEWHSRGQVPFSTMSMESWVLLTAASFFNLLAQNLYTVCNQKGNPVTVSLITYLQIFYNWVCDILIFHIVFIWQQYFGMAVTIGACLWLAVRESKK
jgi:drug/metabolite transporter (DMT)-like permease